MAKSYEQMKDDERKRSYKIVNKMKSKMDCTKCIWYDSVAGCGKVKWDEKGDCVNYFETNKTVVSECWKCKRHNGNKGCGVADFNEKGICNNFETDEIKKEKVDNVNHPKHYEGHTSIECIDAMILTFGAKRTAEYCVQNAYKYAWRHKYKNKLEDLKKAEWYLNEFDDLATWCETKFSAEGAIEKKYLEIGQVLRGMIKTERKRYEVSK